MATIPPTRMVAFAALFDPNIAGVIFTQEPRPDKAAPGFLNWSRFVTPAQLLTLVKSRCTVTVKAVRCE